MATDAEVIDARGLKCPLPVLRLEKRLDQLAAGKTLTVLATDPMARIDIPLYCRQRGHDCVVDTDGAVTRFSVTKGVAD